MAPLIITDLTRVVPFCEGCAVSADTKPTRPDQGEKVSSSVSELLRTGRIKHCALPSVPLLLFVPDVRVVPEGGRCAT